MSTQELYIRIGLADFCNSQQFRCYDFVELPLIVPWRVFEGMRIDLQVVSYTCEYDSTRVFQFPQLLHHVQQGMSMWSGGTASDGGDHSSMMQLHGGNTATPPREYHAGLETGRGPAALRNFQRACWLRTFWMPPLMLNHGLAVTAWIWHANDIAKTHFGQQGFQSERLKLCGWIFFANEQEVGNPFCWGLRQESPWSFQLDHLLLSARSRDSAIFTVLPQPEDHRPDADQQTVQVVTLPAQYHLSPTLVLIVRMSFNRAAGTQAIRCGIPCTPLTLFHQMGQMAFCGLWTLCQVHFRHGDCRRTFTDTEMIHLPIASKVEMDFRRSQVKIDHCQMVERESQYARMVANQVYQYNPYVHGRAADQSSLNPRKEPRDEYPGDHTNLMQFGAGQSHTYWQTVSRQLQNDIEEVRIRTLQPSERCILTGTSFHFVLETLTGTRHWVETCYSSDHQSPQNFLAWFVEQMPTRHSRQEAGLARVFLASRRIMPSAWTVLIPRMPLLQLIPVLVRFLPAGDYHDTLHILHVDSMQSIRNLYDYVSSRLREQPPELVPIKGQIHDIVVEPERYTNMFYGLVIDIQELALQPSPSFSLEDGSTPSSTSSSTGPSGSVPPDDDEVVFMQRHRTIDRSGEGSDGGPTSSSQPVTLTTISMQASTLDSGPPPLRQPASHFVDRDEALGRTRDFLLEYWRGQPWYSTQDHLFVHCISFQRGVTMSRYVLCPSAILVDVLATEYFSDWCNQVCPPVDYVHSRVFPARTELHQNVPTILMLDQCMGYDIPIAVVVLRYDVEGEPLILTSVATQTVSVSLILEWIGERVIELHDFVLEHNGCEIAAHDTIAFEPGDVLFLRTLPGPRIRELSTSQGYQPDAEDSEDGSRSSWELHEPPNDQTSFFQITRRLRPSAARGLLRPPSANLQLTRFSVRHLLYMKVLKKLMWVVDRSFSFYTIDSLPPPGNPDWWLATDLEKLDDYFQLGDHYVVTDYKPKKREIRLYDVLHIAKNQAPVLPRGRRITIQLSDKLLASGEVEVSLPDYQPLIDSLLMPSSSTCLPINDMKRWLQEDLHEEIDKLQCFVPMAGDRFQLYTDGSYMPATSANASWSLVVFCRRADQTGFVHCDYGVVETDAQSDGWCGATKADARAGEINALLRAIEWAFSTSFDLPHSFRFDAQSIGFGAAGRYGYQAHSVAMKILRAMSLALETRLHGQVSWMYVRARAGIFGNELADALAKTALQKCTVCPVRARPDYVAYCCGQRASIENLWWQFVRSDENCSLPSIGARAISAKRLDVPLEEDARLPHRLLQPQVTMPHIDKVLKISIMTFNVLSLHGGHHVAYMREQVAACGHHIVCLQETRVKTSKLVVSQSHFRVTSAAQVGHGGTEIWLLRSDARSGVQYVTKDRIRVLYATSEILILRVVYMKFDLLVFSAHAPHSGSPVDNVHDYWQELTTELMRWAHQLPYFIGGIDGNAHFDLPCAPHVGPHGLEPKANLAGGCLKMLLQKLGGFCRQPSSMFTKGKPILGLVQLMGVPPDVITSYCLQNG